MDPLAGSYYVESLTNELEAGAERYFEEIEKLGGVIRAIELGYFQREIHRAAKRYQDEIEGGDRTIVGMNKFVEDEEEIKIPLLKIDGSVADVQCANLAGWRAARDNGAVADRLRDLGDACGTTANLMQRLFESARAGATEGEMADVFRDKFGTWSEPEFF